MKQGTAVVTLSTMVNRTYSLATTSLCEEFAIYILCEIQKEEIRRRRELKATRRGAFQNSLKDGVIGTIFFKNAIPSPLPYLH